MTKKNIEYLRSIQMVNSNQFMVWSLNKAPTRLLSQCQFSVVFDSWEFISHFGGRGLTKWIRNGKIHNTLTVCSDRLILISSWPDALAMAPTRLVFPTPGEPSRRIGRGSWRARNTRWAFWEVVGELRVYVLANFSGGGSGPGYNTK